MSELTLVLLKPDAVSRGLTGKILAILEDAGLSVRALELRLATRELVDAHYVATEDWLAGVGGKTLTGYTEYGLDAKKELGTEDAVEIGRLVKGWLVDYMVSGPVVAMILEGNHSVDNVRRLVGKTLPIYADPGSIRGRFSIDSPDAANAERRPVRNLIHASGTPAEAASEIALWFPTFGQSAGGRA